ncbi:beta-galactosidase [Polaribacter sp. Z022]|uniref:beta-galactosidase n=1 Tax=Polaribacter sp. Z022 TaxID=2927125 RepID=UPI00201FE12D|nr:beta-galactosidase [Polaribacter sp. Z022]MCL7754615.1 beta-galactosidase [Polaribacter sp. Z022]
MKFLKTIIIFFFLGLANYAHAQLEQTAITKINELKAKITQAENAGLDVFKEKLTVRTAEVFLEFANWDENNIAENTSHFELVTRYKDNAAQMAADLPDFERSEVILMLDEAIATINQVIAGTIVRKPVPNIDWENISIKGNIVLSNNTPVFLSDYTWRPSTTQLNGFFGDKDGYFMTSSDVADAQGNIKTNVINELQSKPNGKFGSVFLNHKGPPQWALDKYDNFTVGGTLFTTYDIDNPGAREMQSFLLDGCVPLMAGKNYTKMGYMLTNEPHWNSIANTWESDPVSEYTKAKFRTWLSNKHTTISKLNSLWNTNFASFNDVTIEIPMQQNLQGKPIWYDWMTFNMYRVTDWFVFLKNKIKENDPDAKTHIKIMPHLWSDNSKDSGIDLEALTRLTGVIGNDAKSWNSYMWGSTEEWEEHYSFHWREVSMAYDFMKSVSPNKIIYNSESHFLSTNKFRDLYLKPSYARASYWLAYVSGMNVSQTWFWARQADGSIRNNAGKGYAGSNNQQPRIINEVESTVLDLNANAEDIYAFQQLKKPIRIFYSKTSAINKSNHLDEVFSLYESMYFDGSPIGFASKGIIEENNNNDWNVILVYKTEFVTVDEFNALQTYLDNGGTIIIDSESLKKNEYGANHSMNLNVSNGTILQASSLASFKTKAFDLLSDKNELPNLKIVETNSLNIKGCFSRTISKQNGKEVITIVNLGKESTQVSLSMRDNGTISSIKNLLTGKELSTNFTMKRDDVLLLEVTPSSLSNNEEIIDEFKYFPNPTSGIIKFQDNKIINNLTIYNSLGQQIDKIYVAKNNIQLDLSGYSSGVYFVKLIIENKEKRVSVIKN